MLVNIIHLIESNINQQIFPLIVENSYNFVSSYFVGKVLTFSITLKLLIKKARPIWLAFNVKLR